MEIGSGRTVKSVGYNGSVPGPILRFPEGKAVTVDVFNETDVPKSSTGTECTFHPLSTVRPKKGHRVGLMKDVISVNRRSTAAVDFVADNPGLSLFHCHMQLHMDFGFMQLLEYAR